MGRAALTQCAQQPPRRVLTGLACRGRRVPRHGYTVLWDGKPCGTVTSGAPSPTLGMPIAMAYTEPEIPGLAAAEPGLHALMEIASRRSLRVRSLSGDEQRVMELLGGPSDRQTVA